MAHPIKIAFIGLILAVLTVLSVGEAALAETLQAGKYTKVYKGQEGLVVTVVDTKTNEAAKIVLITGVSSKIDDIPLLHEVESFDKGTALSTIIADERHWTLVSEDSYWGGKSIKLTLPENFKKRHSLWYDETLSKKSSPSKILARYHKAQKDGSIQKVQIYTKSDHKAHTNRVFKESVNRAKSACGAPIGAKIEWETFKKHHVKSIPIATYCGVVAKQLATYCEAHSLKTVAVDGITCRVGKSQKLSLVKKRLWWTIPKEGMINREALDDSIVKFIKQ